MSGLDGLFLVVDVEDGVLRDRALMHAEDADFADVGVVHDLEDLGDDGQILVRLRHEGCAVGIKKERVVGFRRAR